MRKLQLFMFLVGVCGTLLAQNNDAPEVLAPTIDSYLMAKSTSTHPLAQHGGTFVAEGSQYKVNPRFLVAISGGETTFGVHVCGQNNAFNWFWNGSCPASPFDSWDSGIHTVAKYMQKSYILHGYTTIPTISKKYCTSGCTNWVPLISQFYSALGGDPNAPVLWNGTAPPPVAVTTTPGTVTPPVVTTPPVTTSTPETEPESVAAPTLSAQLGTVTRNGFFLSPSRTVSLTVQATAENLGTLKPSTVSLLLNAATGSTIVGTLKPMPTETGGKTEYSGTVTLPEAKLQNATVGVQMTLTKGSSKRISQILHAADLTVPVASHTPMYIAIGVVLTLLVLCGVIFAVIRARAGNTTTATPAAPVVTK